MGRSRGGLIAKIHALVDAEDRPVKIALTAGQAGDAPAAGQMPPLVAPGATLIADRAYDANVIRDASARKKAWVNIPPRIIRKDALAFSAWAYTQRNFVERFSNRIERFVGLATDATDPPTPFSPLPSSPQSEYGLQQYESAPEAARSSRRSACRDSARPARMAEAGAGNRASAAPGPRSPRGVRPRHHPAEQNRQRLG